MNTKTLQTPAAVLREAVERGLLAGSDLFPQALFVLGASDARALLDTQTAPALTPAQKAAPQLLAALSRVFEDWETLTGQDLAEENEDVRSIGEQARAAIAAATVREREALQIDGTIGDVYDNAATHGPWVVFDPNKQDNVAGPFNTRAEAEDAKRRLELLAAPIWTPDNVTHALCRTILHEDRAGPFTPEERATVAAELNNTNTLRP